MIDSFDYNSVPISIGCLVGKYNEFAQQGSECEAEIERLREELTKNAEALGNIQAAIEQLGYVEFHCHGGLITECKAQRKAPARKVHAKR